MAWAVEGWMAFQQVERYSIEKKKTWESVQQQKPWGTWEKAHQEQRPVYL